MTVDVETVERLAAGHPEQFRGGRIDRTRPVGERITVEAAWVKAARCLEEGNPRRAAYWAGIANGHGEGA